jgi:membrane-bound ClpP family serine protease
MTTLPRILLAVLAAILLVLAPAQGDEEQTPADPAASPAPQPALQPVPQPVPQPAPQPATSVPPTSAAPVATPIPVAAPIQASVPAFRQAKNVAVITIKGEIDAGGRLGESVIVASVERRIRTAVRAGADAIVFEFDTPGGEVNASLRVASLIKDSPVANTVAWVRPRALSGGAVAALAAREIIATDPASFGDAMPIQFGPGGAKAVTDNELLKKVLPPLISDVVDSARRHNEAMGRYQRDEFLVRAIVANDMELWWVRENSTGVEVAIDRREFEMLFPGQSPDGPTRLASTSVGRRTQASSIPNAPGGSAKLAAVASELAANAPTRSSVRPPFSPADAGKWTLVEKIMDGTAPATFSAPDLAQLNLIANVVVLPGGARQLVPIESDEQLRAFFGASEIRRLDSSWSEGLVLFLTNPIVRGILIVLFILALFAEMSHPGAVIPGVISLVALLALIGPPLLIGMANWWEVLAIVAGIGLICLEAFVIPGTTVVGAAGLMLLFGGLVATFLPGGQGLFPGSRQESNTLAWGLGTVLAALVTSGVGVFFIAKHFGSLPIFSKMVLRPAEDAESITTIGLADQPTGAPAKIGEVGTALTRMAPAGRIDIDGRVIDASSDFGFIQAGTKVRVTSVDAFRIGVERVQDA